MHLTMMSFLFQYVAPDFLPLAYEELPKPYAHREAVLNAYVYVHQTLHTANKRLSKRGGQTMAITPRHYLDFINHFVSSSFTLDKMNSLDVTMFGLIQV